MRLPLPPSANQPITAASSASGNSNTLFSSPQEDDFSLSYSFQDNLAQLPLEKSVSNKRKKESGMEGDDGSAAPARKRKGGGAGGKKAEATTQLLTSWVALVDEEKADRGASGAAEHSEMENLEATHRDTQRAMLGYYSNLQDYYSELDDSDELRAKRVRLSASSVVIAAAAAAAEEEGGEKGGSGEEKGRSVGAVHHQRRLWVKDRSTAWWDRCSHPDFPDEEFRKAFRMGRATFDMICDELGSAVAKEDTTLRLAIPVRQRVAVCIWRLATGEPLRLVSKRFGLGISTCHKLVLDVCSAIKTVLMPKFLQWSNDPSAAGAIRSRFESLSGIPNVVGSMYTTHIPITAPKISVAAYFNKRHTERNQKTSYSITVQGVVDPDGVFTDVCIGWPGSYPDDQVLENSALCQRAKTGSLANQWIVGSAGYPLTDWVLVPYAHQNLTWTQHAFNEKIGEVQRVAKDAFARLKRRWKCLQKRTEVKLQDLPVVLGAICVLHNVCEIQKEEMDPELRYELVDDEMVAENSIRSAAAKQTRDNIAHNLLHHGLAGTAFFQ